MSRLLILLILLAGCEQTHETIEYHRHEIEEPLIIKDVRCYQTRTNSKRIRCPIVIKDEVKG